MQPMPGIGFISAIWWEIKIADWDYKSQSHTESISQADHRQRSG